MNDNENEEIKTLTNEAEQTVQTNKEAITTEQITVPVQQEVTKPKRNKLLPIIIILAVLAAACAFVYFGTDLIKKDKKEETKEEKTNDKDEKRGENQAGEADKYVGIYASENDKMYIRKKSADSFEYNISGNFMGTAKIEGESAKETTSFNKDTYFEFKIVDEGIELAYIADENSMVAADTGIYKKVGEYTKENVYKEAIGDQQYINSKYSGVFETEGIEIYLVQTSENKAKLTVNKVEDPEVSNITEEFEIQDENKLVAYSFFNEEEIAYEIEFNDKEFNLIVHDDIFGVHDSDKKLEKTYKYSRSLTTDEVIKAFYGQF